MNPSYRRQADHYRRWKIGYIIATVISIIAFTAFLMFQQAALTITAAVLATLCAFIAATLHQDHKVYQGLADYYDESEIHDQIEL